MVDRDRLDEGHDLSSGLRDAQPRVDRFDMDQARSRVERSLFGSAAPARLGRYLVLGKTGDGGMGVVYTAYDPDLHRKVALKILHPQDENALARERLIAEARALARLDHPNVVKIHDVITQHDQVVLVMEWIEGETLACWECAQPRTWREALSIYLQAAHGLAAAHDVGIVHRDFKPANAILGADRRVRVLDFGLASQNDEASSPVSAMPLASPAAGSERAGVHPLTATGAMVGTLGYAPPEQLRGDAAGAASDQFSFAVSLHRTVEGVAPFAGDDIATRCAAIQAGAIQTSSDRRVPAWLRAILSRALSADPAARYPSMHAMLAQLSRPRGWRRWRLPTAIAAAVVLVVATVASQRIAGDRLAACDGGVADIAPIWNSAVRGRLEAALAASAIPGGDDIRSRVLRGLDAYGSRWTALHRDACVAHRRGVQSASLLDRRMLCLRKRLVDFDTAVSVIAQSTAASAGKAVDVIAGIPAIEECADSERLQAEHPAPPASLQAEVERVRTVMSQAAALDRAGRSADALALASRASEAASRAGYPPLIADASLLRGKLLMNGGNPDLATEVLSNAIEVALAQRDLRVAVEAGARKLFTEGIQTGDLAALARDTRFLLPLSIGLPGDHFARPLLLNNIAAVYMAAARPAQARQYYEQAHDALLGQREIDPELLCIDQNLARVTADARARESLAREAWTRLRTVLGDANAATLNALHIYAKLTEAPDQALPLLGQACRAYAAIHPELVVDRSYCESYRAFLAEQLGDRDQALLAYDGLIGLGRTSADPVVQSHAALAAASTAFLRGDTTGAMRIWQGVVEREGNSEHWWIRARAAHAELGLGTAHRWLRQNASAAAHFARAIDAYREATAVDEATEYRARLRAAEAGLASVRQP